MLARLVITALLAASFMTPALAEDPEHTVIVVVDRATHALLKHRIAVAVEEVCRSYSTVESYQWPEVDDCRKVAWASANRQLAALSGSGEIRVSAR